MGRTIAGSYVILDMVGVGGMGRVYRAEQRMLGRTVAIKVIHPHLLSDEQSVARFYTEARAASRLNHPNSVSIIDFGRTDDGILYLVMEFLQGKDLARLMREDGPLPVARICALVSAVLDALGEAHALGVVHRDLKPENVIIERLRAGGDLVKVVDFGLAKLLSGAQTQPSITLPGLVCGTPDYMSPEQGRGEDVDERGDVYSAGVLLFELLTERLPFMADTPTNVVLRHIQDPVPDPREVAPQRNLPESIVEVVMRALAKSPAERYQKAEEMADALRRVGLQLRPSDLEIACVACGHQSPADKRFCGECGKPLQSTPTSSPRVALPSRMSLDQQQPALIGRERELSRVFELRDQAQGEFVAVCLHGEPGIGKTRLLAEIAERAASEGDLVVGAGPHDSGAAVPYHPIRAMMSSLFSAEEGGLLALVPAHEAQNPLAAAGIREVVEPTGLLGADGDPRSGAVACAFMSAIRAALQRSSAARAVVILDDLQRCDGLTPLVLRQLPEFASGVSLLLLTASTMARPSLLPTGTVTMQLKGLNREEAEALWRGSLPDELADGDEERTLLPLYLDQLRRLGVNEGDAEPIPTRLADVVSQRVQRLDASARRMLQAVAVLGTRCSLTALQKVADRADVPALDHLASRGFIVRRKEHVEVAHPFVRALVEASTPAEARKQLHQRALSVESALGAPLEVRAQHAYGTGESLAALMLLERMGSLAAQRGDPAAAVLGYRRGLELARRELLESGDPALEDAIASFSRQLGTALSRRGDLIGAEGVLREALEFCGPHSLQRVRILVAVAKVVAARSRHRDAYRLLGQALELAIQLDSASEQADVQMAVGALRLTDGNHKGAVAALAAALELLEEAKAPMLRLASTAVELAAATSASDDSAAAVRALERAGELAQQAQAPYLAARVLGMLAQLEDGRGEQQTARLRYAEAAKLAAQAGAATLKRRLIAASDGEPADFREPTESHPPPLEETGPGA